MSVDGKRKLFRMVVPAYPNYNVFSGVSHKTTALGPVCVGTCISKLPGWDVEIIDENNYHRPGPQDEASRPDHAALQQQRPADAVGFYGGLSCTVPRLFSLARFYRQAGALTIGGGHHLDFLPQEALEHGLDYVVHGEGERTACELLRAWETGVPADGVHGLSCLRDGKLFTTKLRSPITDFDSLPLPDFGLLRHARLALYPIGRTRGCGMNCEFCSVKGKARSCSPERLLEQITILSKTMGARRFFVVDDQFAQDRRETIRFCEMLASYRRSTGLDLRLAVQIRLDCGNDTWMLQAMRRCGVWFVAIGMESPIDEELEAMGKRIRAANMIRLVRNFQQQGFFIHGMFIFGYPMRQGNGFSMPAGVRMQRFRDFFLKARLNTIQVLTPVPVPGSRLRDRLDREGRILPQHEIGWEYYDGSFPVIQPDPPLTTDDLLHAVQYLMGGFYGFRRLAGVALHTLCFPLAMLKPSGLRESWRRWYRSWLNDAIGSSGYFIVRNWRRAFRSSPFSEKLRRVEGKT